MAIGQAAVSCSVLRGGGAVAPPRRVDVCIVGGGPAGLALAAHLARLDISILVLESGGLDFDPIANALNKLEPDQSPYVTRSESRRRQLGGTAHKWNTRVGDAWGARFIRLSEVDFEARDWIPDSGWPFGIDELEPYYDRAEALCGVSHEHDEKELEGAWLRRDDSPVRTYVERFGLARLFTRDLPARLKAAPRVTVVTRATVTQLITDPAGARMEGVEFTRRGGVREKIQASVVALAAGGIENARLLLLSRAVHKNGIGNSHDLVGRFFMDHYRFDWGLLVPASPSLFESARIFDLAPSEGGYRMAKLTIAPSMLRSAGLLNSSVELSPGLSDDSYQLVRLMRKLAKGNGGSKIQALADLRRKWRLAADLADTGVRLAWHQKRFPRNFNRWSRLDHFGTRFATFKLVQTIEQGPSPANRLQLIDARDSLGQLRIRIDSRLSSHDIDSIGRTRSLVAAHLEARQIGMVVADEGLRLHDPGGIHHHMGTTRMHHSPRKGVTDANGEVHDVRNLFVVGSSTFPTGGYANPTLTILALAIRAADHIAGRFVASRPVPVEVGNAQ